VPEPTVPIDQAARDRIVGDLETTLFVEAGAGTGKTSALVDRIVSLVVSGVSVEHIAAITFTDRAATQLRDRVRRRLEAMTTGMPERTATPAASIFATIPPILVLLFVPFA